MNSVDPNIKENWLLVVNTNTKLNIGDVIKKKVFYERNLKPPIIVILLMLFFQPRISKNIPSTTTISLIAKQTNLKRNQWRIQDFFTTGRTPSKPLLGSGQRRKRRVHDLLQNTKNCAWIPFAKLKRNSLSNVDFQRT